MLYLRIIRTIVCGFVVVILGGCGGAGSGTRKAAELNDSVSGMNEARQISQETHISTKDEFSSSSESRPVSGSTSREREFSSAQRSVSSDSRSFRSAHSSIDTS